MTKQFPLRTLLTVTTGRLLTKPTSNGNGIGDLYQILGWMTNDSPFTHQLPRFGDECKPWLIRWFPELAEVNETLLTLDSALEAVSGGLPGSMEAAVNVWLTRITKKFDLKATYDVPRIPMDDHDRRCPVDEAIEMCGKDKVVAVKLPA